MTPLAAASSGKFVSSRRGFRPRATSACTSRPGVFVVLAAGWWFGDIAEDMSRNAATRQLDDRVILWFQEQASPPLTLLARIVTAFGSVAFIAAGSIGTAVALMARHSFYRLLAVALTMGGGSLLNILLKHFFHRQRPVLENPLVTLSSFGFPSGHTMGATLFYGLLTLLLAHSTRWGWSHRIFAFSAAALFIALVGISRIYLGAHYLTDVLGAIAVGLAWLAFCWTGVETLRKWRGRSSR
jgi:undecaprenyl-diphosphatase